MFHSLHASPPELEASHLLSESAWLLKNLEHDHTPQVDYIYRSSSNSKSNNFSLMHLIMEISNSHDRHQFFSEILIFKKLLGKIDHQQKIDIMLALSLLTMS